MQSGSDLLKRFEAQGFSGLIGEQTRELAAYMEQQSVFTGTAAPLLISQALAEANALFLEHDEAGGIQVDFVKQLDRMVIRDLKRIQAANHPGEAAQIAKDFRDEIRRKVSGYSTTAIYDPQG